MKGQYDAVLMTGRHKKSQAGKMSKWEMDWI